MYVNWKNGISPREFRKNFTKDIINCIEIDNEINKKAVRQSAVNALMAKVRF